MRLPLASLLLLAACATQPPADAAPAGPLSTDPREDSLLRAAGPGVERRGDTLRVAGAAFVNDTTEGERWLIHRYDGRIARTPFHGVVLNFYEGQGYLLVHERSGAGVRVDARPVASPSGARLATASFDLEAGFDPNALAILAPDADTVVTLWRNAPDTWGPDSIAWHGDDTLHVVQRWTTEAGPGNYARREALVIRNGEKWDQLQDAGPKGSP